jgi:hypothetical protein
MSRERLHAKHSIMLEALSLGDVISVVFLFPISNLKSQITNFLCGSSLNRQSPTVTRPVRVQLPSTHPTPTSFELRVQSFDLRRVSNVRPETPNSKPVFGNCGREVRHLIVDQADDGSSPFSSANLCQKPDRQGGPVAKRALAGARASDTHASVAKSDQGTCLLSRGM